MSKKAKVPEFFEDIEPGFGRARSLHDDVIEAGKVITLHEVKEWLKSQSVKLRSSNKQYNSFLHLLHVPLVLLIR